MGKNKQQTGSSISHSTTLEEMAEFWDTHDTTDYLDQFEDIDIVVTMRPRHRIVIEEETFGRVAVEARRRGIQPETLINLWVAEQLHRLDELHTAHGTLDSAEKQLAEKGEPYSAE